MNQYTWNRCNPVICHGFSQKLTKPQLCPAQSENQLRCVSVASLNAANATPSRGRAP